MSSNQEAFKKNTLTVRDAGESKIWYTALQRQRYRAWYLHANNY